MIADRFTLITKDERKSKLAEIEELKRNHQKKGGLLTPDVLFQIENSVGPVTTAFGWEQIEEFVTELV